MIKGGHAVMFDLLRRLTWPVVLGVVLMGLAIAASHGLKPSRFWFSTQGELNLDASVPKQIGAWRMVETAALPMVDPTVEASLQTLYSQTLNRVYVDGSGRYIMVSLAYGKNQSSWNTAAHRPEFCYSGQGFQIEPRGIHSVALSGHAIDTAHFVGSKQGRVEAVTYWVTLADTVALPGLSRKLQQLKFGLQGFIVDGMLVRISSLGADLPSEFEAQAQFVKDLERAMSSDVKPRFFGR